MGRTVHHPLWIGFSGRVSRRR